MDLAVQIISAVPVEVWAGIASAIGVSAAVEAIKKWVSSLGEKRIILLTAFLSFVSTIIAVYGDWLTANPAVLGANTAAVLGVSQLAYRFLIKPARELVHDARIGKQVQSTRTVQTPATAPDTQPQVVGELSESEFQY